MSNGDKHRKIECLINYCFIASQTLYFSMFVTIYSVLQSPFAYSLTHILYKLKIECLWSNENMIDDINLDIGCL
jgi:hypothetical protein